MRLERTMKLRQPIEFEGRSIAEITLLEPTAGQLQQVMGIDAKSNAERNAKYISVSANIPAGAVALMVARDFNEAVEMITGFMQDAPPAGGASS